MSSWRRVAGRPHGVPKPGPTFGAKPAVASSQNGSSVLIFHSDRTRFFRLLSFTAIVQSIFWISAASLAPDVREHTDDGSGEKMAFYKRYGLTVACLFMATIFGGMGVMIPRRYVTQLVLKKRQAAPVLQMETYTMFGRRKFEVPANAVDFSTARTSAIGKDMLPFRIQQHRFFYLLDTRVGEVKNHQLLRQIMRA
ncbi:hypothetical protein PTSG_01165 [Salpingoeca rosetta]|uniref:Transmembrane protein 223 n=1 Tax=Salpingoeca rosetta (strain ATCC 50818 / BSB-021) TaxID=946362 RepID=F2U0Z9_SALR5|nr:uncharacterized protein PTSG_01165 [Salpingoeca rosetta]EGD80573.1 hypothetical protein PTSG_01165 [Salpingoeca rosetta]|eukprot:XP_004997134.1 hypothetical protein PTSG_01165 [Salpingoeca rosetta]